MDSVKLSGNLQKSNLKASIFVKDQPAGEVLARLADTLDLEWHKKDKSWYLSESKGQELERQAWKERISGTKRAALKTLQFLADWIDAPQAKFDQAMSAAKKRQSSGAWGDDPFGIGEATNFEAVQVARTYEIRREAILALVKAGPSLFGQSQTVLSHLSGEDQVFIQFHASELGEASLSFGKRGPFGISSNGYALYVDDSDMPFEGLTSYLSNWIQPMPQSQVQKLKLEPINPKEFGQLTLSDVVEHVSAKSKIPCIVDASRALVKVDSNPDVWKLLSDTSMERFEGGWLQYRPVDPWRAHAFDPNERDFRLFQALSHPSLEDLASFFSRQNIFQHQGFRQGFSYSRYLTSQNFQAWPALRFWLTLSTEQRREALNQSPFAFPTLAGAPAKAFAQVYSDPDSNDGDFVGRPPLTWNWNEQSFALARESTVWFEANEGAHQVRGSFDQMTDAQRDRLKSAKEVTYTFFFGVDRANSFHFNVVLPAPKPDPIPPPNESSSSSSEE